MDTKTYYAIRTIRDTYLKQSDEGLKELNKEDIIYADLFPRHDLANVYLANICVALNDFLEDEENKKENPLLVNMGLSVEEIEISVRMKGDK